MLNPDADRLARWTISACKATVEGTTDRCLMSVMNDLWCPSNAQFPITGTVTERQQCGGSTNVAFAFRDGVTIRVKSFAPPHGSTCIKRQLTDAELAQVLGEEALQAAQIARLANVTDTIMSSAGIAPENLLHTKINGKIPYLETSRNAYLTALGTDDYPFLSAWARNAEQTHFFDRFTHVEFAKPNMCNCFNATTPLEIKNLCK